MATKKKRGKRGERAHQVELGKRIDDIAALLIQGLSRAQIMQYVADNADWGVATRTLDGYIKKATQQIRDSAPDKRRDQLDLVTHRLEDLYALCMGSQDYKAALGVIAKQIDLFGLKEAAVIAKLEGDQNNG